MTKTEQTPVSTQFKISMKSRPFDRILPLLLWSSLTIYLPSCGSPMTERGAEEVEKLWTENNCAEVALGNRMTTGKKESLELINVRFSACSGPLHFDSIQNHSFLRQSIAEKLFFEHSEKDDFDGIALDFQLKPNSPQITKTYEYTYVKDLNRLELGDTIYIDHR